LSDGIIKEFPESSAARRHRPPRARNARHRSDP